MKRQLKFRAWTGSTFEWLDGTYYLNQNGLFESVDGPDLETYEQDWPVMQFTGMKDSKGKDIYDGDIVAHSISETQHYKGVVEWSDVSWGIKSYWSQEQDLKGVTYYEGFVQNDHMLHDYKIEVIGNIYDNPELLPA